MVVEQGKQNMSGTPLTPPETAASPLSSPPLPFSLSPFLPCSSAPLPLSGRVVLVTRPGEQAQELRELLTVLGAEVLEQPGITVSDPPDWSPVDAALEQLASYDWLVFSSSNGVKRLLDRLMFRGGSLEQLAKVKLAAIGPGTAAELVRYGLAVERRSARVSRRIAGRGPGPARCRQAIPVGPRQSRPAGAARAVACCRRHRGAGRGLLDHRRRGGRSPGRRRARAGRVDWVTVTSSAIARAIVGLFGEQLRKARLASISPVTSQTLRELGHPPAAEAAQYTMAGLVAAIVLSTEY